MSDYANCKIYQFLHDDKVIYVGHTATTMAVRLEGHKYNCRNKPTQKLYNYVRKVGWDALTIEIIEGFPCKLKSEAVVREQHWIDKLKPTLNMRPAFFTYDAKLKKSIKNGDSKHCHRCNLDLIDDDDYTRHKFKAHWEQAWIDEYMAKHPNFKR